MLFEQPTPKQLRKCITPSRTCAGTPSTQDACFNQGKRVCRNAHEQPGHLLDRWAMDLPMAKRSCKLQRTAKSFPILFLRRDAPEEGPARRSGSRRRGTLASMRRKQMRRRIQGPGVNSCPLLGCCCLRLTSDKGEIQVLLFSAFGFCFCARNIGRLQ